MEVSNSWEDDSSNLRWADEIKNKKVIYNSSVNLKRICLGTVDLDDLQDLLIFKGKNIDHRNLVLKGTGGGFPSNNCRSIPGTDYQIIKKLIESNRETSSYHFEKLGIGTKNETNKSIEDEVIYPQNTSSYYVLLRHKSEKNPYRDDPDGKYYRFSALANYTRIQPGTKTIWFDRLDGDFYFWGYGTVSKIIKRPDETKRGGIDYEAILEDFTFFKQEKDSLEISGKFLKKASKKHKIRHQRLPKL